MADSLLTAASDLRKQTATFISLMISNLPSSSSLFKRGAMGYFIIEGFGAWWLTHLPLTTDVELKNVKPLEKLHKSSKDDLLDLEVHVGKQSTPKADTQSKSTHPERLAPHADQLEKGGFFGLATR